MMLALDAGPVELSVTWVRSASSSVFAGEVCHTTQVVTSSAMAPTHWNLRRS